VNSTTASLLGLGIIVLAFAAAAPIQKQGGSHRNGLNTKVGEYQDSGSDIALLLGRASDRLGIAVGLEFSGEIPSKAVSIHVSKGTAADVFSAIVEHAPGYKWVEQDGVVDVLPEHSAESVLDLKIDHFEVRDAMPDEIRDAITSLPEVKAWLTQNKVVERSFITPIILINDNGKAALPRASIDVRGLTLREIINKIVRSPGFHGWSFVRYGEANRYLSIEIG
jgi:hypothetical protein